MEETKQRFRPYINKTNEVWLAIQENAGINEADVKYKVGDLSAATIDASLRVLHEGGHVTREPSGKKNQRGRNLYNYTANDQKPYVPFFEVAPSEGGEGSRKVTRLPEKGSWARHARTAAQATSAADLGQMRKPTEAPAALVGSSETPIEPSQRATSPSDQADDHARLGDAIAVWKSEEGRRIVEKKTVLTFDLAGGKVSVSLEEARQIYRELHEVFGRTKP